MANDPFWIDPAEEDRILGEARQRRAQFEAIRSTVTPQMGMRATQIAQRWPNASAGVVQVGAQAGLDDAEVDAIASKDDGGLWNAIGSAASFVGSAVEQLYEQAIKPTIRGVFTLSETLAQELIQRPATAALTAEGNLLTNPGAFREAYRDYGDSAGLNVLQGDIAPDVEGGSLGQGFFAAGGAQARSEQERTLTVGGERATLGGALPHSRMVGEMFGYDSFAHNAVAGVTQFAADVLLDPLALVTGGTATTARQLAKAGAISDTGRAYRAIEGGISGAVKARKKYSASEAKDILDQLRGSAGLVSGGGRQATIIDRATDFIGKREVVEALAEHDAYTIYQSFKRSGANHIDHDLVRGLGRTKDVDGISTTLLDAVQRGKVTERGFYSGLQGTRRRIADSKLGGISPRGKVSVDDLDDSIDKIDSFLRQAKVARDDRAGIFERLLDVGVAPAEEKSEQFFDVVTDAMKLAQGNLSGDIDIVSNLVRIQKGEVDALREFGIEAAGDPILTPFIKTRVDPGTGTTTLLPTPQLTSELAQEGMHLPDVTAIRRAAKRATKLEKLYTSKGWEAGSDAMRWVTRDLFKPAAILRPAYVVRIGVEEQARLAAAGYDSLLTHPFRFIQANILAKKHDVSLTGDSWETVADGLNAINRAAHNHHAGGNATAARVWDQLPKPETPTKGYLAAWTRELSQLTAAREARWFAQNGPDMDGFVAWARTTEEGKQQVARISRINPEAQAIATDDTALRLWGESVAARVAIKTGGVAERLPNGGYRIDRWGDDDLLGYISTGRISDLPTRTGAKVRAPDRNNIGTVLSVDDDGMATVQFIAPDGARAVKRFRNDDLRYVASKGRTDNAAVANILKGKFDAGPQVVKFEHIGDGTIDQMGKWDRALNWTFETLTAKPTNTLARYPAFRQGYIRNARETMDALATHDLRVEFAQQLDEMFTLTKAEKTDIARAVKAAEGKTGFYDDITELDEVLKFRSAEQVKELLFDATKRGNIQDAYEVAVPFFDAWAEVTRTWARLVKENPAFFVRGGQALQSARQSGVVYANDHGEEMFAMPGGGMLSKMFPGDDSMRLEGRLQGANLVAQGVGPGFGPVVQWATGAFIDKTAHTAQLREWLSPFGTGGVESAGDLADPGSFLGGLMPAWAEKAANAITGGKIDEVQWNATVGDVMRVLANSGTYRPGDPNDQQRLIDDAVKGGRFVLLLRAFTQGVSITGASATWEVKTDGAGAEAIPEGWDPKADPDGVFHSLGVLANAYRELRDHYQGDDDIATAKFIELYGVEPFYISQAKTRSVSELPVTEQGNYWLKDHADAARRHRSVIGYLAPPDEGDLDYSVYRAQIETGDRQSLSAEQQLQLANKAKASQMYYHARTLLEGLPKKQRDAALGQVKAAIDGHFPGWQDPVLGVDEKHNTDQRIQRLYAAVADPELADSPVVPSLSIYLQARDQLLAEAQRRGVKSFDAQASADLKAALLNVGMLIRQRDENFANVWTLLRREVE